jgi:hypothetical protein
MMALEKGEEQAEVVPDGTRDHSNGKKVPPEKEEPSVDLLQWYLKMIITYLMGQHHLIGPAFS